MMSVVAIMRRRVTTQRPIPQRRLIQPLHTQLLAIRLRVTLNRLTARRQRFRATLSIAIRLTAHRHAECIRNRHTHSRPIASPYILNLLTLSPLTLNQAIRNPVIVRQDIIERRLTQRRVIKPHSTPIQGRRTFMADSRVQVFTS